MATSRDDFVIAIRSVFLKKGNQQRFSLIGLICFCVVLIFLSRINFSAINYLKSGLNEIIYRISFIVSLPEKQINNSFVAVNKHLKLYDQYNSLKDELKSLKGKNYNLNYLQSENERLRKLIDEYIINSDELVAKVLLDKNSPFLKSLIVNKGSKDNLKIGMAVLDGPYLIGKIVEVNYATSRVLLISDLNSKIPVILEPGDIQSIMTGTGKNFGKIQHFEKEYNISEKKLIYTSGAGGVFKSGIPIGEFIDENNIQFFSDLSQLTFVKLVSFEKEEKLLMSVESKKTIFKKILETAPLLLLFISVLNEFDFNYLNYKYFSFNFPFILIYYWSLKRSESLGYGFIFIAGLFNDVVIGFPIGLSGLTYLIICGFAAYLRNITLRPNIINDWFFFLLTILVATSINYFLLISIFNVDVNYYDLTGNIFFTFLFYYIFSHIFEFYYNRVFKRVKND